MVIVADAYPAAVNTVLCQMFRARMETACSVEKTNTTLTLECVVQRGR